MRLVYAFSRIAKYLVGIPVLVNIVMLISKTTWLGIKILTCICASTIGFSRRPHCPRCPAIRKIYQQAGLPLPGFVLILLSNMHWLFLSFPFSTGREADDSESSSTSEYSGTESAT